MEGSPLRVVLVDKTVREEWPEGCRRAFYFYHVGDTVELGVSYEPGAEVAIDFCGRQDRAIVPENGVLRKEYVLDREGQCRIRVSAGDRAWEKTVYVYPEGRAREPVEVSACSAVYSDNHLTVMGVLSSRTGGYYPVRLVAYRDGNRIADVMAGVVEPGATSFEITMPWYAEVPDTLHVTVVPELECLDGWEANKYTCTTRVVLPSAGQPARGPVAGAALVRTGRIASGRILGLGGFRVEPVGVEPAITGYRDEARLRVSVSRTRPGQVMVLRGTRVVARLNGVGHRDAQPCVHPSRQLRGRVQGARRGAAAEDTRGTGLGCLAPHAAPLEDSRGRRRVHGQQRAARPDAGASRPGLPCRGRRLSREGRVEGRQRQAQGRWQHPGRGHTGVHRHRRRPGGRPLEGRGRGRGRGEDNVKTKEEMASELRRRLGIDVAFEKLPAQDLATLYNILVNEQLACAICQRLCPQCSEGLLKKISKYLGVSVEELLSSLLDQGQGDLGFRVERPRRRT